jgi:endonuclease-3
LAAPAPPEGPDGTKRPFRLTTVFRLLRSAVAPYPPAALFALHDRGFTSAFEQLVACLISVRARDEVMLPAALRLFERARTPSAVARLSVEEIDRLIRPSTFHESKARQIHAIARRAAEELGDAVPCEPTVLLSFHGVGPKCANLVLGIACGVPRVGVDVHVHRIVNRWGYVHTRTPEETTVALEEKLPERYQVEINRLLVPFGKHICTRLRPHCSTCPLLEMCQQVGVVDPR